MIIQKMKVKIIDAKKSEKGEIDLPEQFDEPLREDIIKKAVLAIEANMRQPYGAYPKAGMEVSAELSRRRHDYRGSYGHGISRVPRKILSRRGTRFNWAGALAPGTVGGRRAHPPKAEKIWAHKINKKERRLAIRSAIAATADKSVVSRRGHILPEGYPFVIDSDAENIDKASHAKKMLETLGFKEDLERGKKKKIKGGRGKTRGRKYQRRKSLLVVVSDDCKLKKALNNVPGVEIVNVADLNAKVLAPGAVPGRAAVFTKKAIEKMAEKRLFM